MARTNRQRLEAIPSAIARGKGFRARVQAAGRDVVKLADLMAEAIAMHREQRAIEAVGPDGRTMITIEALEALYCLDAARSAYLTARGSNQTADAA